MKLEEKSSNNQAKQVAIHKALQEIELLNKEGISPLTAIISRTAEFPLIHFTT